MSIEIYNLKYRKAIIIWLLTGCLLIAAMVVIGGITRLTGSGLSITEWKLIHGTIPPLNEKEWMEEFDSYKAIPQYKLLNYNFSLDDFKQIYFWEYFHRLLGRFIGIVFLFPFLFFWIKKQFSKSMMKKMLLLFCLGGLQGFLGWFMVKSGLSERTSVSHYRLAIHLVSAFITFGATFYVALDFIFPMRRSYDIHLKKLYKLSWITMSVLLLQIVYGAFVAGLKAGRIFNSFPKMDDDWISASVFMSIQKSGMIAFADAMPVIQFVHRYVAYAVVIMFLILYVTTKKMNTARLGKLLYPEVEKTLWLLPFLVLVQFLLGVFTLLYGVPVWLGVVHQAMAFLLFGMMVFIIHRFKTGNVAESNA